ncbi:hypothetical protein SAMN04244553_5096 [Nocardia amikacinitolerans]|uniref:TY-Chap N-terminal domain-containing protein n=1 Tax=Nocardia amikacinitolerans TaxID=756689 RepID=A0A285LT64_9NOCA|nr:hypothetical protein [Nocardia amikacinitolerans]SNY88134.1 hypothetical protein SAMN04244553_5096 [Nocardia amikacinitolerans]
MTAASTDIWTQFAIDLAERLNEGLTHSTFVLANDEQGRTCVQFTGEAKPDGFIITDVMDSTRPHGQEDWLSTEGQQRMITDGWIPHPEGGPFWQREISWSGDLETCRIAADCAVTVLREILCRETPPPAITSHHYYGW